MNKTYFKVGLAAAVVLGALPAISALRTNHNTLTKSPTIGKEFAQPKEEQTPDPKQEEAKDDAQAPKANAPLRVAPPDGSPLPRIVATVYDYSTGSIGTYALPEVTGGEMTLISPVSSYYGGALHGNTFYACHDGRYEDYWDTDSDPHGHNIQGYDIETWQPVGSEMHFSTYRASDMAINPLNGKGYAFCDYGAMMYHLYELDLTSGAQTDVMPSSSMFPEETSRALAFNSEGVLYGVTKNGKFGTVNLTTGVNSGTFTLTGIAGDMRHGWTADFDPDSGNFIFIHNANDSSTGNVEKATIYSIVPGTGQMTVLAEYPGKCITSMYIAPENIAASAPGTPTNATGNFSAGALNGVISFNMPTTLHDGSSASGTATWKVLDGTEQLATGSAAYGTQVNANVTVTEGGKHNFNIVVSNSNGDGKKLRLPMWVGPDVPVAPAPVTVNYNESAGTFAVSWTAVFTGANGGYVNPANVRYTIRRMPGNVTVAENLTTTNYTDTYTPAGIENITYEVTASQGELVSEAAVSVPVTSGSLALPYRMSDSGTYNYLDGWSTFDINNDGSTWEQMSDHVRYKYNSANAADDWIISPPIAAVAGSRYECKLWTYAYGWSAPSSYPERLEVKIGYAASPLAMTTTVVTPTVVDAISNDPACLEFDIVPEHAGKMFVGIHAISDRDQYYLYVKDLTISAPVGNASPAAVTAMSVISDPDGALTVTGSGRAPQTTVEGGQLTSIDKVIVRNGSRTVAELTGVAPGATFTFSDNAAVEGVQEYSAVAVCGGTEGAPGEPGRCYVGINYPTPPTDIIITEGATPGTVHVSWTAPTADRDGYPLNGACSYSVEVYPDNAYYHGNATYGDINGCEYTFTPTFANGRNYGFVRAKVSTCNAKGQSYAEKSDNIPVGTPCLLPFVESFPNYTLMHPWGDGESNGPQIASITDDERSMSYNQFNGWNRLMDRSFNSSEGSQDNDNGFAGMFGWSYATDAFGNYHNEYTDLLSPKIIIPSGGTPVLSFYTYNWLNYNGKDMNEIDVYVVSDGERHLLKHQVVGDLGTTQAWEFVAADLSAYAGKTISLAIRGTIKANGDYGYNWILIDNLRIQTMAATDLRIDGIEAPVTAVPGEDFNITAHVTNAGSTDIATFTATLYKNNAEIETVTCEALPFSSSRVISFTHRLSVNDPIGNEYRIGVNAEGDPTPADNLTAGAVVARNLQLLPEPRNVATHDNQLTWTVPDVANADPAPFTDTFDDYPGFLEMEIFPTEVGEWVFVDRDEAPIGGIISASTYELIEFPGIPHHSAQSWWLQSRLFEEFNNDYAGHSGYQYLANMYVVNSAFNEGVAQDDWAISPELCGKEQLISIMARSYDRYTPETIELLWSNGSLNPEDFTLARRIEELSGDWTQLVFVVPEGARRFAIRGCSAEVTGTNQTFVDDVTFVAATGEPQALVLNGYNIYRDGLLAQFIDASSTSFTRPDNATYSVSAVYDKGESRAVEQNTGVGITTASRDLRISSQAGQIVIAGMSGETYSIANAWGAIVARGIGNGTVRIPAAAGVYVVRAGSMVTKIAVR